MSGATSDLDSKLRDLFGSKADIVHAWYSFDETLGYYIVRTPLRTPSEGVKLVFVRTFYIGLHKPENVEISIDKITVLDAKRDNKGV